ncbi:hypothetical protein PS6_000137 [Mucor atramentarius]
MVTPNQIFTSDVETLIDYEQQAIDPHYVQTVEQLLDNFLQVFSVLEEKRADTILESIRACHASLEENTALLKTNVNLLKELLNKVHDMKTMPRDPAVNLKVPTPTNKKRKNRSYRVQLDQNKGNTQSKITDFF